MAMVMQRNNFVIEPPDFVSFELDSLGQKEAVLTLTNTSDNCLAFKVKVSTKDKHRYTVQPSSAIVRRKTKIRFILREESVKELIATHTQNSITPDPFAKGADRFLLQILHLPADFFDSISTQSEISASVEKQWRKISSNTLSNSKLRARFVFPRQDTPTTAVSVHGVEGDDEKNQVQTLREQFNEVHSNKRELTCQHIHERILCLK